MKRSEQISDVVARCGKFFIKPQGADTGSTYESRQFQSQIDELRAQLRETVALLCSDQDYTDHLQLNVDNDFAFLPKEIVHDVIESASKKDGHDWDIKTLALIQGSWAEFGKIATTDDKFRDMEIENFNKLKHLEANAPKFYSKIVFRCIPDNLFPIFELMGTRFSSITWLEWTTYLVQSSAPTPSVVVNFIKRQLKSKYLRKLTFITENKTNELNEDLVNFVRRPQFEKLKLNSLLAVEAFEEAHKAWATTTLFQVRRKVINVEISCETDDKIKKQFDSNLEIFDDWSEICLQHPVHNSSHMKMILSKWCSERFRAATHD